MADIPVEIWLNIARFLSDEDLLVLRELNSLFLSLAMDIRYREVVVYASDKLTDSMDKWNRISDPFVASRVRHLTLFFYDHIDPSTAADFSNRLKRFRKDLRGAVIRILGPFWSRNRKMVPDFPGSLHHTMSQVFSAAPSFSKIKKLSIHSASIRPSLNPLLGPLWSSFSSKLHTLSLDIHLAQYQQLMQSTAFLTHLKELRLDLDSPQEGHNALSFVADVVSFINCLRPRLEVLAIRSHHMLDVSDVFSRLSTFPVLTRLYMDLIMPGDDSQNPSGLKRFIHHISYNLQSLHIRFIPSDVFSSWAGFSTSWQFFFAACREDSKCFSRLQTLELKPTPFDVHTGVLLGFIQCTTRTLENLTIHEQTLLQDDAGLLFDALSQCHNLTTLKISLYSLSIALLDQLAMAVPGLQRLSMLLRDSITIPNGLQANFLQDLKTRSYTNWKLNDLSIMSTGWDSKPAHRNIMVAFADSIPSLRTFFGRERMDWAFLLSSTRTESPLPTDASSVQHSYSHDPF